MYIIYTESKEQTDFAKELCLKFGLKFEDNKERLISLRTDHFYLYITSKKEIWIWSSASIETKETLDAKVHKNNYNKDEKIISLDDIPKIFGPPALTMGDLKLGQKFKYTHMGVYDWIYIGEFKDRILVQDPTNGVIIASGHKKTDEVTLL